MITLKNVTKLYPRSDKPAVHDLSIHVPEGETCVLIGPSGCGKTTTMKMVNRLIEPTSGEIILNGKNIMDQDPVELRRNIGYVIQQIGLFPHMTIRDNIAVVPRLLGWEESRIDNRVDELIEMVNMEPSEYRSRYPRELSGGQRQRIGVARALAADPPVMLMDEPFGAIDPINRDNLQNEFLRLQKRLKKTIIFVTHDIDEAIKMGTLICILEVGGIKQQFDTPENILNNPANDFVADFVGADRGIKKLNLVRVGDVMTRENTTAAPDEDIAIVIKRMEEKKYKSILVVDGKNRLLGYVSLKRALKNSDKKVHELLQEMITVTEEEATMKNAFSELLSFGIDYMPVVDEKEHLLGIVTTQVAQGLIKSD